MRWLKYLLWGLGILLIPVIGLVGYVAVFGIESLINPGPEQRNVTAEEAGIRVVTVAEGLEHPWALAFLPDGRMLVTERPGRLRTVTAAGALSEPIAGVPPVFVRGQGGLMDVALDPAFAENGLIYLSYSEPDPGDADLAATAVMRARLAGDRLAEAQVIFRQEPKVEGFGHFGSRFVFAPDGTLFVSLGERFSYKEEAQNLANTLGTMVRINPDGSAPDDNPFRDTPAAAPEIWSYGHRNIQGAALHPETGLLWVHEHGARGGDELNIPEAGRNYGWPVITLGRDYSYAKIGEGTHKEGMEQPIYHWTPSIAPSGMAFYTGEVFPAWQGDLFIGSLVHRRLVRLTLDGETVTGEEQMLGELGERLRDVRQGPDGALYLLTDNANGRILRLEPS